MRITIHLMRGARCGLMALLALGILNAAAQPYPSRPVKIIAPFAAGGLADVLARSTAERLVGNTPEQFAALITEDRTRWEKVIAAAGIKLPQ